MLFQHIGGDDVSVDLNKKSKREEAVTKAKIQSDMLV